MNNEFPVAKVAARSMLGRFGTVLFRLAIFATALYLAYAIASALSFLFIAVYYIGAILFLVLSFIFTLGMAYLTGELSVDKIFISFDSITELIETIHPYVKYVIIGAMALSALAILFNCFEAPKRRKLYKIIVPAVLIVVGVVGLIITLSV